jgi:hypothetical protein
MVPQLLNANLYAITELADRFANVRLTSPSSMNRAPLATPPHGYSARRRGFFRRCGLGIATLRNQVDPD